MCNIDFVSADCHKYEKSLDHVFVFPMLKDDVHQVIKIAIQCFHLDDRSLYIYVDENKRKISIQEALFRQIAVESGNVET